MVSSFLWGTLLQWMLWPLLPKVDLPNKVVPFQFLLNFDRWYKCWNLIYICIIQSLVLCACFIWSYAEILVVKLQVLYGLIIYMNTWQEQNQLFYARCFVGTVILNLSSLLKWQERILKYENSFKYVYFLLVSRFTLQCEFRRTCLYIRPKSASSFHACSSVTGVSESTSGFKLLSICVGVESISTEALEYLCAQQYL